MNNISQFIQNGSNGYNKSPWDTNDLLVRIFGNPPIDGYSPSLYEKTSGGGGSDSATAANQVQLYNLMSVLVNGVSVNTKQDIQIALETSIRDYIGDATALGYPNLIYIINATNTALNSIKVNSDQTNALLSALQNTITNTDNNIQSLQSRPQNAYQITHTETASTLALLKTAIDTFKTANQGYYLTSINVFPDGINYSAFITYSQQ